MKVPVYESDDIIATKENFITYIMRECFIPTYEEAEEAFYEGIASGDIRRCGWSG